MRSRPAWITRGLCRTVARNASTRGLRSPRARPASVSPRAAVATSATPATGPSGPKSSGWRRASAMIDMPPIECPHSTTGPDGATVRITAATSSESCAIVQVSGGAASDFPCPRWSKNTSRIRRCAQCSARSNR
ncbi:Uncharacterised protein [Mycobacteroides abscessus subsp. abscessus]|nr:Uncharacterised protein [Mycobacteroides abscessus subsp. abscessus]